MHFPHFWETSHWSSLQRIFDVGEYINEGFCNIKWTRNAGNSSCREISNGCLACCRFQGETFFWGGEERQADCFKREREKMYQFKRERDWLAAFRERADWLDLERGTHLIIRLASVQVGPLIMWQNLGPIGHSSFSHWPVGGAITITTFRSRRWWSVSNLGPIAQT